MIMRKGEILSTSIFCFPQWFKNLLLQGYQNSRLCSKTSWLISYLNIVVLECENGNYGQGCRETCGKCFNNEVCDHIDGLCTSCGSGYRGAQCKTGRYCLGHIRNKNVFLTLVIYFI